MKDRFAAHAQGNALVSIRIFSLESSFLLLTPQKHFWDGNKTEFDVFSDHKKLP